MNDVDAFRMDWARFHPKSVPVSDTLKWSEPECFLRLHSLPEAKRYADNDGEARIISHRTQIAGDETLKSAGDIWLVLAKWQSNPDLVIPYHGETVDLDVTDPDAAAHFSAENAAWEARIDMTIRMRGLAHAWTFPFPDDECDYAIHVARTHWPDVRDPALLRQIADDEIDRIFWMSAQTGEIFAPYDGGIDMILSSATRKADLSQRYIDWLPKPA